MEVITKDKFIILAEKMAKQRAILQEELRRTKVDKENAFQILNNYKFFYIIRNNHNTILENHKNTLNQHLNYFNQIKNTLEQKVQNSTISISELKKENIDLKRKKTMYLENIEKLSKDNQKMMEDICQKEQIIHQLQKQLQKKQELIKQITRDNFNYRREFQSKLKLYQEHINELQKKLNSKLNTDKIEYPHSMEDNFTIYNYFTNNYKRIIKPQNLTNELTNQFKNLNQTIVKNVKQEISNRINNERQIVQKTKDGYVFQYYNASKKNCPLCLQRDQYLVPYEIIKDNSRICQEHRAKAYFYQHKKKLSKNNNKKLKKQKSLKQSKMLQDPTEIFKQFFNNSRIKNSVQQHKPLIMCKNEINLQIKGQKSFENIDYMSLIRVTMFLNQQRTKLWNYMNHKMSLIKEHLQLLFNYILDANKAINMMKENINSNQSSKLCKKLETLFHILCLNHTQLKKELDVTLKHILPPPPLDLGNLKNLQQIKYSQQKMNFTPIYIDINRPNQAKLNQMVTKQLDNNLQQPKYLMSYCNQSSNFSIQQQLKKKRYIQQVPNIKYQQVTYYNYKTNQQLPNQNNKKYLQEPKYNNKKYVNNFNTIKIQQMTDYNKQLPNYSNIKQQQQSNHYQINLLPKKNNKCNQINYNNKQQQLFNQKNLKQWIVTNYDNATNGNQQENSYKQIVIKTNNNHDRKQQTININKKTNGYLQSIKSKINNKTYGQQIKKYFQTENEIDFENKKQHFYSHKQLYENNRQQIKKLNKVIDALQNEKKQIIKLIKRYPVLFPHCLVYFKNKDNLSPYHLQSDIQNLRIQNYVIQLQNSQEQKQRMKMQILKLNENLEMAKSGKYVNKLEKDKKFFFEDQNIQQLISMIQVYIKEVIQYAEITDIFIMNKDILQKDLKFLEKHKENKMHSTLIQKLSIVKQRQSINFTPQQQVQQLKKDKKILMQRIQQLEKREKNQIKKQQQMLLQNKKQKLINMNEQQSNLLFMLLIQAKAIQSFIQNQSET